MQKIKEQENKEKELSYKNLYDKSNQNQVKNYSPMRTTPAKKERLPTIHERETENFSIKPLTEEKEDNESIKRKGNQNQEKGKVERREEFEQSGKSLQFEVTAKSSFKEKETPLKPPINTHTKAKPIINSINDTIESKNVPNPKKKVEINSMSDTIQEPKSKANSTLSSKILNSSPLKMTRDELSSSNIEKIEETLVKSIATFQNNRSETSKTNKPITTKTSFKHEVYNGHVDKVALYNYLTEEWRKTPFLNKTKSSEKVSLTTKSSTKQDYSSENNIKNVLQRVKIESRQAS